MTKVNDTEDLPEVARIYKTAISIGQGHRAVEIVAQAFGIHRVTAHRHVNAARAAGLIPVSEHFPRRVRFVSGGSSWMACHECRRPWPCPDAPSTDQESSNVPHS